MRCCGGQQNRYGSPSLWKSLGPQSYTAPITLWCPLCSAVVFVCLCSLCAPHLLFHYCTSSPNLTEREGHRQQNVHAGERTPSCCSGRHFCGTIPAIQLHMPEQWGSLTAPHAGESVSHNITELQIGGRRKITLIFILLRTFGGEWTSHLVGSFWNRCTAPWWLWQYLLVSWGP